MRILLDTGMMAFIVCAPVFIEDTLNTGAQNAVYIAIPGALGIATGLLIAPALIALVGARPVVAGGFVTFVVVLLLLPFVDSIAPELTRTLGPFRTLQGWVGVSDAIVATMMLLPIAGLGVSFVQVGARTEVYRRTPSNVIAQVFATQSALGSVAALLPTFLVGVLLDILPVRAVLILIGTLLTAIAVNAWWRWRRAPQPVPAT